VGGPGADQAWSALPRPVGLWSNRAWAQRSVSTGDAASGVPCALGLAYAG